MNAETLYELRDIAAELGANREVRAVIVAGAGKHFSVGLDVNLIRMMVGREADEYRENILKLQECLDAFEALEKPTIAKIRGFCIGGGMILAACCDFRIASERSIFSLPEVKRGIGVIMGAARITRLCGVSVTKELILFGGRHDALDLFEYGFLNDVADEEELDEAAAHLAEKFRNLPPRAVGINKRIINQGLEMSLRASQNLEIDAQAELLDSPDFKEAMDSYFEKRPPRYTGA